MNWRHIPLLIIATIVTYLLHEGAHWAIGEALGYDMWMKINSVGLARGEYSAEWHQTFVSAAGPIMTLVQGMIAFLIMRKRKVLGVFVFLFTAFMMRFVAMMVSINNPNDEARVGEWLGLGPWTLHIFVVGILLFLTVRSGSALKLKWQSFAFGYVIVSLVITAIIFSEALLPVFNLYR